MYGTGYLGVDIANKITTIREELFGVGYDEGQTNEYNYTNLSSGIIYDKIDDGTLDDTLAYTGQTEDTPARKTFDDYVTQYNLLKSAYQTYLSDTTNNNGDLTTLGTTGNDEGKVVGRAGFYLRYATSHMRKLSFYRFRRIKTITDGSPTYEDLFADDYYDITDYPNLFDEYKDNLLSNLFDNSTLDIWNSCGYWTYNSSFTYPPAPDPVSNPLYDEEPDFTLISNMISDASYSSEETFLSSLVETYETELLLFGNPDVSLIFNKINIAKLVDPKSIEMRVIDDSYTSFEEFYENKGINKLIEDFDIDTLTPDRIRVE